MTQINGYVDEFENGLITGWAANLENFSEELIVNIYINDELVDTVVAKEHRPDLSEIGSEHCNHGFTYKLDQKKLSTQRNSKISLFVKDFEIIGSPLSSLLNMFFLHIPKTGGTSLRLELEQKYSPWEILPDQYAINRLKGEYPESDLAKYCRDEELKSYRMLRGHFHFLYKNLLTPPIQTMTILREPIDRTISELRHIYRDRYQPTGLTFEEFLNQKGKEVIYRLRDHQTRYFASDVFSPKNKYENGVKTPHSIRYEIDLTDADLDTAILRLKSIDFVGITERLDSFYDQIKENLVLKNDELRKENISPENYPIGEAWIEFIRKHTRYDRLLYNVAVDLTESYNKFKF